MKETMGVMPMYYFFSKISWSPFFSLNVKPFGVM
jgi:hypothetical protein